LTDIPAKPHASVPGPASNFQHLRIEDLLRRLTKRAELNAKNNLLSRCNEWLKKKNVDLEEKNDRLEKMNDYLEKKDAEHLCTIEHKDNLIRLHVRYLLFRHKEKEGKKKMKEKMD
jgi:hypothetical protein